MEGLEFKVFNENVTGISVSKYKHPNIDDIILYFQNRYGIALKDRKNKKNIEFLLYQINVHKGLKQMFIDLGYYDRRDD